MTPPGVLVAIHQPDFLPYSGFWFKMAEADRFVLAMHDQFQKHGYQRRVRMRATWVSHQLVGKPALCPISEVVVQTGWQGRLVDAIRGRYATARYWRDRGAVLCDAITACQGDSLVEVNVALIEVIRPMLGIATPMVVTAPPLGQGVDRLVEVVSAVGGTSYLSGAGGRAYMGERPESRFAERGIDLRWSTHSPLTGDSIVTVILDHDDPAETVRRRQA